MNYRTTNFFIVLIFALFLSVPIYAQTGIGTKSTDKNADLTLGSNDKGLLINKVELKAIDSPKPVNNDPDALTVGILVYNTKKAGDLKEGFYYWGKNKKWNELGKSTNVTNIVPAKTRELFFVDFKETDLQYTINNSTPGQTIPIEGLDVDYTATEDGDVFLDYIMYSTISQTYNVSVPNEAVAANVFCDVTVTSDYNPIVNNKTIALSPYIPKDKGLNVTTGVGSIQFKVVKGKTYKVRMKAKETYAIKTFPTRNYQVRVGMFNLQGDTARSSLKVTFLSKAKN